MRVYIPPTEAEYREAIAHWDQLAAEEDVEAGREGSEVDGVNRRRAERYRRTAESIRLEQSTGEPHCVCCLRPYRMHVK